MSQPNGVTISSGQSQPDAEKPSPALYMTISTRLLELVTFVLMAIWVFSYLGGLSFQPKISTKGNDTSQLFNWHPLLMALAFPVLMTEALLAYRAPLAALDRPQQKLVHAAFHSAALLSVVLGVLAAWKSHTLKLPVPTPNLYSAHSYMGVLTITLFLFQYTLGVLAFLFHAIKQRAELMPYHRFLGAATYWSGLSTALMGIQEKGTFLQLSKKVAGNVYSGTLKVPAILSIFIILTGMVTLFQVWPAAKPASDPAGLALLPNADDDDV